MNDEFDLHRFIKAQEPVYETVIQELRNGKMRPEHMDFIFPRLGLVRQSADVLSALAD